jgi:hypothetical protein
MILQYHKIDNYSSVCKKCKNVNCSYERKWNKRNLKPYLSRARIRTYELNIIKEQLNEIELLDKSHTSMI